MNNPREPLDPRIVRLIGLLYRTERLTDGHITKLLQPVGLTCAQHQVLKILAAEDQPLPLGQIAERMRTVRSNATQMVDRLAAEGLVERILDPADRRLVLAKIRDEGSRRYEAARAVEQEVEHELALLFTPGELDQLTTLLGRLDAAWG